MAHESATRSPSSPSGRMSRKASWTDAVGTAVLLVITAPYRRTFQLYTWKPLKEMRYVDADRARFMRAVKQWKADKYQELQSVQVASSFCVGATLAVMSWTKIPNPTWVADALWFSSLMCSIWAVITSIQTKSLLDDLPDKEQLNETINDFDFERTRRVILRYKKRPGINHWLMMFLWQFPSMTMSYAWCTFLSGLTLYVCTPFIHHEGWNNNMKIAIAYLSVGLLGLISYIFSTVFVYAGEKDYARAPESTRASTHEAEEYRVPPLHKLAMRDGGHANGGAPVKRRPSLLI